MLCIIQCLKIHIYIDIIYIGGLRDRLTNYSKRLDLRMRVMIVCVVLVVAENGCLLLAIIIKMLHVVCLACFIRNCSGHTYVWMCCMLRLGKL